MRNFVRLLIALLFAAPAFAQSPIEPAKLPANTAFYVAWRGMESQKNALQANSLLALWNDPDFAPFRAALVQEMARDSGRQPKEKRLEPADLQEFAALLDNPFVFGVLSKPAEQMAGKPPEKEGAAPAQGESASKWDGSFFVYDASGKEVLYQKFLSRMREGDDEKPEIVRFTVGSIQAEKVVRKSHTNHYALAGHFAVSAADRGVFEEIVHRVTPGASRGFGTGRSLGDVSAFREAQQALQPGSMLDLFLKIPDVRELAPSGASAQQAQFSAVMNGLHIDALHAICAGLKLDGTATRISGAILGDTRPGTPFDIWPSGDGRFASLALAPAGSLSYGTAQVDLMALYDLLRKALLSTSPQGQAGMVDMVEGMAASRLGMPLPEALRLFTGEFASFSSSNDFNPEANVYAFGIAKKPDTLKLLRAVLSDRITSERNEGDATFLKISLSSQRSSAGLAQWKFYHLAVTPNFILGATRTDTLRSLLASANSGGLATDAHFRQARARFPQNVNGISYYDFTRVNWAAARDFWLGKLRESAKNPDDAKRLDLIRFLNWDVFSRHLHTAAGASWKDAHGFRFDEWIE